MTGCGALKQADGKLVRVTGRTVVIKTASGATVTVATTASTKVSMFGLPLSYITDGAKVMASGPRAGGAIEAQYVTFGTPRSNGPTQVPPGLVADHGTVTKVNRTEFILVTDGGSRIRVATSSQTIVIKPPPSATVSELRPGVVTIAVGHVEPDGTLSAQGVLQSSPGGPGKVEVRNCSPQSIDAAVSAGAASQS